MNDLPLSAKEIDETLIEYIDAWTELAIENRGFADTFQKDSTRLKIHDIVARHASQIASDLERLKAELDKQKDK
jgi:hypothetical protein